MPAIISLKNVSKTYQSGFEALRNINIDLEQGEIFALLGPNGAGKTTLINIVCGIVTPTSGTISIDGRDISRDYRHVRAMVGLVPQEIAVGMFETVLATVNFSRGLFGKPPDPSLVERVLKDLALWDKKDARIMTLSGGMKRRLMIAKALVHEPRILFLDEPTAGVDVELRRGMWDVVRALKASGVTIILTTHYIEEAEEMADRVGVIAKGEIILVAPKAELMRKLGKKRLTIELAHPVAKLPHGLSARGLTIADAGRKLVYSYDTKAEHTGITGLLNDLRGAGIAFKDLSTDQSSLEDIFVDLVRTGP